MNNNKNRFSSINVNDKNYGFKPTSEVDTEEILLRATNPALRDAWEKYQIVLKLVKKQNGPK